MRFQPTSFSSGCLALLGVLALYAVPAIARDQEPLSKRGEGVARRLTADQYRLSVTDIFGQTIKFGGRFEPDVRQDGLLAVGASKVSVTAAGFEQYDAIARSVADQVVSAAYRPSLIPCKPASLTGPDDACAQMFLSKVGRLLYRRPLRAEEIAGRVQVAHESAKRLNSFYEGLSISLATMLQSSQFLFVQETVEPDPKRSGAFRLDGYSKASQLSLFLWNAIPDDALLTAAEKGELDTEKGLARQVDRMLSSPRLQHGVRAFFSDMLGFDTFETLDKDAAIYPKFSSDVGADAAEQTLRTITNVLLTNAGDYRDIFTTRKTFLTPLLGSIYGVPVVTQARNGAPTHWVPYEYAEGDPRAGILSQVSFVALHSHPGRTSPTLRGKALRQNILCQKVPDPPGDVNFEVVQDTNNAQYKTARERLTAHSGEPMCAGCHKLVDPMGLALENLDSDGGYRTTENGVLIDASGALDGIKFTDAVGLGKAVHANAATTSCLVTRLYSYALGRKPAKTEADFAKYLEKSFAADGYTFPALMRRIVTSKTFFNIESSQAGLVEESYSKVALQTNPIRENGK